MTLLIDIRNTASTSNMNSKPGWTEASFWYVIHFPTSALTRTVYSNCPYLHASKTLFSQVHRSLTPSMGLASVLEEDEHTDVGTHDSSNSNSNSLLSSSSFHNLTHLQQSPPQPPIGRRTKRGLFAFLFSALTNLYSNCMPGGRDVRDRVPIRVRTCNRTWSVSIATFSG